ncbi:alpha-glucosidase [Treponema sp. HNW]|uniref:alpha-glucosidase n=1 Tax=Treponema sp. HNW TaxID=3116654 RepID=UPI003D0BEE96
MFFGFKSKRSKKTVGSVPWWKTRTVYQIYPRSFCDSNGDGIGDIRGIISKLDYLADLGVGIIWLSPVYNSPNDDNGYDISDYRSIHPDFGTLSDMKRLIAEAERRDIKIIMDLVINHTSDEHEWFKQSRSSKDNPYRDYYIWHEGKNGKEPNNWTSFFAGSAWEKDVRTGEYYLHLFSKKQPDLNWKNPKVAEEVRSILKYWLDMGIAGFRCDVINVIYKTSLEDGKKRLILTGREHYLSQKGCHSILRSLKSDVFSQYDCFTVGETVMVSTADANELCAPERKELDMVFSFEHMDADCINNKWFKTSFKPEKLFSVLEKWQNEVDWNANYFENHDQPRIVSRYGSFTGIAESEKEGRERFAKLFAVLLFTLRGTPFMYQGQELGMTNGDFKDWGDLRDVESFNVAGLMKKLHFPASKVWKLILKASRDNARTPMQWSAESGGGFTAGTPWIKLNANRAHINAREQISREDSVYAFYKKLIALRNETPELSEGSFKRIKSPKNVFAYLRSLSAHNCLVLLNFNRHAIRLNHDIQKYLVPEKNGHAGRILCSNDSHNPLSGTLGAHQACIIRL